MLLNWSLLTPILIAFDVLAVDMIKSPSKTSLKCWPSYFANIKLAMLVFANGIQKSVIAIKTRPLLMLVMDGGKLRNNYRDVFVGWFDIISQMFTG